MASAVSERIVLKSANQNELPSQGTISFDFASSIKLPILAEQTQHGFYAECFGFSVPLFGIVDEGEPEHGRQYNYIGYEGLGHDTNSVLSMLHLFLARDCSILSHVDILTIHADSCSGQNKNKFVLA